MSKTSKIVVNSAKFEFPMGYYHYISGEFIPYTKPYNRYYPSFMEMSDKDHLCVASGAWERYQRNPAEFSKGFAPWAKGPRKEESFYENLQGIHFDKVDIAYLDWIKSNGSGTLKKLVEEYANTVGANRWDGVSQFTVEKVQHPPYIGWMYANLATWTDYLGRKDMESDSWENALSKSKPQTRKYEGATFIRVNDHIPYVDRDPSPWTTVFGMIEGKGDLKFKGNNLLVLPERTADLSKEWTPFDPSNLLAMIRLCHQQYEERKKTGKEVSMSYEWLDKAKASAQDKEAGLTFFKHVPTWKTLTWVYQSEAPNPNIKEWCKAKNIVETPTMKIEAGLGGKSKKPVWILKDLGESKKVEIFHTKSLWIIEDFTRKSSIKKTPEGVKVITKKTSEKKDPAFYSKMAWDAVLLIWSKLKTMYQGISEHGLEPMELREGLLCGPVFHALELLDNLNKGLPEVSPVDGALNAALFGCKSLAQQIEKLILDMATLDRDREGIINLANMKGSKKELPQEVLEDTNEVSYKKKLHYRVFVNNTNCFSVEAIRIG